jgi:ubiquinone/menaquinone biosynthesis C-methylase UbiE
MNVYATHIFPRLMDWMMSQDTFQSLRADALKDVGGDVLEIGYGTALNLAHYPVTVSRLTMIDPARLLRARVERRAARVGFPVTITQEPAELLPFPDRCFDYAISTWTLCTIAEPAQALREVRRVLKPGGAFVFLEHGRSDDAGIAAWQDRLNPIQRLVGCGCNLNRRIDRLIESSGLRLVHHRRFHMPHVPRIVGEMYQGSAVPTASS